MPTWELSYLVFCGTFVRTLLGMDFGIEQLWWWWLMLLEQALTPRDRKSKGKPMAEHGNVIICNSVDAWNGCIQSAKESNKLIVVDFTATWCGPCRIMAPIFAEHSKNFPNVMFLKVDVDDLKTVTEECGVEAMPTFIFIKNGKPVDKVVGANKNELEQKLALHSSS